MRQKFRIGIISAFLVIAVVVGVVAQQRPDFVGEVGGEQQAPRLAVPDMLASAEAGSQIGVFNDTLWNDLDSAGQFEMVSKSFYPRATPRRPEEVHVGEANLPVDPGARGLWLLGWSQPPVTARYMTFGYVEVIGDRLVLNGYLYDTTAANMASAHIFGKRYYAAVSEAGARQLAHDFSRDVLENLGLGSGLAGSRIYFVSDRTGKDEIWAADFDGNNQTQLTNYKNLCMTPAVDKDATKLAFTTFVTGTPNIYIHSLETNRRLTFYNQEASLNTTPWFLPNGSGILYASSISGRSQIYRADLDGRNLQRVSYSHAIDVHPVVNPKTGAQVAFTSGRSGIPQIYLMDMDGANVRKLSPGGGDAVQPSWDPQGENVAFAWTRGFEPGNYNIFIINVATEQLVQLTYGAGRNEHPSWSPSGTHLVFSSNRSGGTQIWTMRADGTQPVRLTSQGRNHMPMWGAK
jgi:TolB protein